MIGLKHRAAAFESLAAAGVCRWEHRRATCIGANGGQHEAGNQLLGFVEIAAAELRAVDEERYLRAKVRI